MKPRKRLFLALLLGSFCLVGAALYGVWLISRPGLAGISDHLPVILGGVVLFVLALLLLGIAGIGAAIAGLPTLAAFQRIAWPTVNILFPVAIFIARLLKIEKETVERSFIAVSNHLVRAKEVQVPAERVLILTPHCIQKDSCPYKITRDVQNCRRCGQCPVDGLLRLAEQYGAHLAVVTGGTLAREVIRRIRPQAVLAIACERDLTSGIQDVFPLPVVGVLNQRPFGPCCNTGVNVGEVEEALLLFVGKRDK